MTGTTRFILAVALGLVLGAGGALAAGGGGGGGGGGKSNASSSSPTAKAYSQAENYVKAGSYDAAIPLLEKVVKFDPKSADAYNYLGYSHRKLGQFGVALEYYKKALAIEPDHLGANEYLGELYLQMGDVAKAEERLSVLDGACFFGCEEYTELKEAIADYKQRKTGS